MTPQTTNDNFRKTVEMDLKKFKDAQAQSKDKVT